MILPHQISPKIKSNPIAALVLLLTMTIVGCDTAQRLETSRMGDYARFGRSVDMSFNVAVVGAYLESTDSGEGAVYVYTGGDPVWSIQARLESPTPADEAFGTAVSVSGNIIAVGAPLDHQPGAFRSGSVYLFERTNYAWNHIQTLSAPLPHQAWEEFGFSVALDGNVLVVGAFDRDQGLVTDAGAAFVFERVANTFVLTDSLAAPLPGAGDHFGGSVEVFGDTIAVTAVQRDDPNLDDTGAVYIFERGVNGFSLAQTLVASDAAEDDVFGSGVSLFEYNDGSRRIVVGALGVDDIDTTAGAAYVFDAPPAGAFTQTVKLLASDGEAFDFFGTDVAIWNESIIIGASGEDSIELDGGSAYAFHYELGGWVEEAKLTKSATQFQAFMGSAVTLYGESALFGATGAEVGELSLTDSGSAEAFRRETNGNWLQSHTLTATGATATGLYGRGLVLDDSALIVSSFERADVHRFDGDAFSIEKVFPTLAASTLYSATIDGDTAVMFGRRNSGLPIGFLEISILDNGEWVQEQLIDPDLVSFAAPEQSANSGVLDLEGDTLILGARRWNGGDGRVFIYERDAGVWGDPQILVSNEADSNIDRNFGNGVALNGDWLAVAEDPSSGVPNSDQHGNVYMFQRQGDEFVEMQILSEPVPSQLDHFGKGIAIFDDLLAVYGGSSETLRVYRRNADVYSEVWSVVIPDLGSVYGVIGLVITADRLVVGVPEADYDGLVSAGEVRTYERQVDDSYIPGNVYRAHDAHSGLRLGGNVTMDGSRIAAAADNGPDGERVYVFDL